MIKYISYESRVSINVSPIYVDNGMEIKFMFIFKDKCFYDEEPLNYKQLLAIVQATLKLNQNYYCYNKVLI